jgi:predicted HTH domain antitoxin
MALRQSRAWGEFPLIRLFRGRMLFFMTTLAVQIPDALLLQSATSVRDLGQEAQLELALHYFKTGRLSSGQAAAMAGIGKVAFLREASSREIPVLDLDDKELERELKV